jgi:hypothetical protein
MVNSRSPAPSKRPAPSLFGFPLIPVALALAASAVCTPHGSILWDYSGPTPVIRTNVLGTGPVIHALRFWPRELEPHLVPLGVSYCNLAMLGYCVQVAGIIRGALGGSANPLHSGVATLLAAFGGGTIVPLLLGVPVFWVRGSDLALAHLIVAWTIVNVSALAPARQQLLEERPTRLICATLFQAFRGCVVFALMETATGATVPGGIGPISLIICGTLGGCGGVLLPFSKGLEPLRSGAPPLMTSAFHAAAAFVAVKTALEMQRVADFTGPLPECVCGNQLRQTAQFLTVVYFVASLQRSG